MNGYDNISKKEFFAAANSGNGFVSFYPQIFGGYRVEQRYLIKGGPGTGKSTFMKKIAQRAEEKGIGVEYYRCSSDPSSLDAVVIGERIAILDATSPHCVDTEVAGARDEIINLGDFWNSDGLRQEKESICELSQKKSECYARAYEYLGAAMCLDEVARSLSCAYVNREKMQKAVSRILKKMPSGNGYELKIGLSDCIGMSGKVHLESYENMAEDLYIINDSFRSASMFLSAIVKEAFQRGDSIRVSYLPLSPQYLNAVFFERSKTAFVIAQKSLKCDRAPMYINMKRFILNDRVREGLKGEYAKNARVQDELEKMAQKELSCAGKWHFELERLYKKYMNFEEENNFLEKFVEKRLNM